MLVACATTTKFMETEREKRETAKKKEKEVLSRGEACQEATARRGAKGA